MNSNVQILDKEKSIFDFLNEKKTQLMSDLIALKTLKKESDIKEAFVKLIIHTWKIERELNEFIINNGLIDNKPSMIVVEALNRFSKELRQIELFLKSLNTKKQYLNLLPDSQENAYEEFIAQLKTIDLSKPQLSNLKINKHINISQNKLLKENLSLKKQQIEVERKFNQDIKKQQQNRINRLNQVLKKQQYDSTQSEQSTESDIFLNLIASINQINVNELKKNLNTAKDNSFFDINCKLAVLAKKLKLQNIQDSKLETHFSKLLATIKNGCANNSDDQSISFKQITPFIIAVLKLLREQKIIINTKTLNLESFSEKLENSLTRYFAEEFKNYGGEKDSIPTDKMDHLDVLNGIAEHIEGSSIIVKDGDYKPYVNYLVNSAKYELTHKLNLSPKLESHNFKRTNYESTLDAITTDIQRNILASKGPTSDKSPLGQLFLSIWTKTENYYFHLQASQTTNSELADSKLNIIRNIRSILEPELNMPAAYKLKALKKLKDYLNEPRKEILSQPRDTKLLEKQSGLAKVFNVAYNKIANLFTVRGKKYVDEISNVIEIYEKQNQNIAKLEKYTKIDAIINKSHETQKIIAETEAIEIVNKSNEMIN